MNAYCLHKKHNEEDVRLKARPVGRCPKARLCVIAFYHAISMISKQCLDSDFRASPEFMILNQSCPRSGTFNTRLCAAVVVCSPGSKLISTGGSQTFTAPRPEGDKSTPVIFANDRGNSSLFILRVGLFQAHCTNTFQRRPVYQKAASITTRP